MEIRNERKSSVKSEGYIQYRVSERDSKSLRVNKTTKKEPTLVI